MFRTLQWEDWAGIALGAWLLASPWLLGYATVDAAVMNALVMGTILVLEELLEVGAREEAEEWIDLVAGAWLVLSPMVLGFEASTAAAMNAVAVGMLTLFFAAWAILRLDEPAARWWHQHVR